MILPKAESVSRRRARALAIRMIRDPGRFGRRCSRPVLQLPTRFSRVRGRECPRIGPPIARKPCQLLVGSGCVTEAMEASRLPLSMCGSGSVWGLSLSPSLPLSLSLSLSLARSLARSLSLSSHRGERHTSRLPSLRARYPSPRRGPQDPAAAATAREAAAASITGSRARCRARRPATPATRPRGIF
eukprot:2064244-Prymnesium_polylepis.1